MQQLLSMSTLAAREYVLDLVRSNPGADLWGSLPCTTMSSYQNVAISRGGEDYVRRLHVRRQRLRRMLQTFREAGDIIIANGGTVSFEWPRYCQGWQEKVLKEFFNDHPFIKILTDGCQFGMKSIMTGKPIFKPWTIYTTSPVLAKRLDRRCPDRQAHGHETIAGKEVWAGIGRCFYQNTKMVTNWTRIISGSI